MSIILKDAKPGFYRLIKDRSVPRDANANEGDILLVKTVTDDIIEAKTGLYFYGYEFGVKHPRDVVYLKVEEITDFTINSSKNNNDDKNSLIGQWISALEKWKRSNSVYGWSKNFCEHAGNTATYNYSPLGILLIDVGQYCIRNNNNIYEFNIDEQFYHRNINNVTTLYDLPNDFHIGKIDFNTLSYIETMPTYYDMDCIINYIKQYQ